MKNFTEPGTYKVRRVYKRHPPHQNAFELLGRINRSRWRGAAAGTVMLRNISIRRNRKGWCTYEFEFLYRMEAALPLHILIRGNWHPFRIYAHDSFGDLRIKSYPLRRIPT